MHLFCCDPSTSTHLVIYISHWLWEEIANCSRKAQRTLEGRSICEGTHQQALTGGNGSRAEEIIAWWPSGSKRQRERGEVKGWTFTSTRQQLNNKVINWLLGKTEQKERQLSHNGGLARAARRAANKRCEKIEIFFNLLRVLLLLLLLWLSSEGFCERKRMRLRADALSLSGSLDRKVLALSFLLKGILQQEPNSYMDKIVLCSL